ncbi:iron hydrogenase [Naematelia encephala]|uniref:Iron hydrogenase n=1 Tax=Naematelia encephala TaxID=71784 RepID=A0A1Y2AXS0_9TREE|nr:iron hydrogenase [Naematelia encephala]
MVGFTLILLCQKIPNGDLDDYLTPSQACIIPVRNSKKPTNGDGVEDQGPTEIQIDANNNYFEVSTFPTSTAGPSAGIVDAQARKALEKAEINLNDCLACSGCITSTESILISAQSHKEVLDFIASTSTSVPRRAVLSISPQTLASLSASYSASSGQAPLPLLVLLRRIRQFLGQPQHGSWQVWDTTFARHMSLRETVVEFEERRSAKGKEKAGLPMLASACPGWVCYAEKAQGDMLPLLSATRSSQAVVGALAKSWWAPRQGLHPEEVYHVTAMPCYDKKLEASRSDFYSDVHKTRDVDCVLTTGELDLLLAQLGFDPFAASPLDNGSTSTDTQASPWPELLNHTGSSSGSYLHTLLNHFASIHPNSTTLNVREIRGSADNVEYVLTDTATGEAIFKGAKCYGFRNLQNLVRKVGKETGIVKGRPGASKLSAAIAARRRKARTGQGDVNTPTTDGSDAESLHAGREDKKLDFVEVMACPGGCVNGGGQMKPVTKVEKVLDEEGYERPVADEGVDEGMRWSTKEWVEKVEHIYWAGLPTPPPSPKMTAADESEPIVLEDSQSRLKEADDLCEDIVREVCGDGAGKRWEFLRTRFRKVEGDVLGGGVTHEAVKW